MQGVAYGNHVQTWINRLTSPEMSITKLKDCRNRYLLHLFISLSSGTLLTSIFSRPPPDVLPMIQSMRCGNQTVPPPSEYDTLWDEQVMEYFKMERNCNVGYHKCAIHKTVECPGDSENRLIGKMLDDHFKFFLHLAHPYVGKLAQAMYRLRASLWIQMLCSISNTVCAEMKGIRNDYMMLLLGYIESGLLLGPFQQFPPEQLVSLKEAAELMPDDGNDYASNSRVDEMLRKMPRPECGAFAFLGISADLCQE